MTLAILQARMSSSRLPGKVLADLVGAPMVLRQIERLQRARSISRIIVATSDHPSDDPLAAALAAAGTRIYRGSLNDVLTRYIGAMDAAGPLDEVMRLTADCPLADPEVIDGTVALHRRLGADYTSNTGERPTFPKGLDVEVFKAAVLRIAATEATDPYDREHVTPFIYRRPERFVVATYSQARDESRTRWTVDRPDDLDFMRAVYGGLYGSDPAFTSSDVRTFVAGRPELQNLGGDPRL